MHSPRHRKRPAPDSARRRAAALLTLIPFLPGADAPPPAPVPPPNPAPAWTVTRGDWTLTLSPDGDILGLVDRAGRELVRSRAGDNRIRVGLVPPGRSPGEVDPDDLTACSKPIKADRTADGAVYDFALAPHLPLRLHYEVRFTTVGGAPAVKRLVHVVADAPPFGEDILVVAGHALGLPDVARHVFVPRPSGRGEEVRNAPGRCWAWPPGGGPLTARGAAEPLAIPLLSESVPGGPLRVTTFADPGFAIAFQLPHEPSGTPGGIRWVLAGRRVPVQESTPRTLWTLLHPGTVDEALAAWRAAALADVPLPPAWIHDIALVHTDFLSRGGRGWLEDVEALERLVPAADRPKVLLLLHGWYDTVGRYTFDAKAGRLDDAWGALAGGGTGLPMTRAEVSRRLAHARSRGFRAGLAFAEGLLACDGAKEPLVPAEVLAGSARTGADVAGRAVVLNPCHPDVQKRLAAYLKALLAAHGGEIDALAWFETADVPAGAVGPPEAPGYAARELMRLVLAFTQESVKARPGLAFLAGDGLGSGFPPCAMMANGCIPAGGYRPGLLPSGLFPNLGRVLWPVPRGEAAPAGIQREAVARLGVPVVTSCGWGAAPGWAEMKDGDRDALLALFRERAARPQRLRWLAD